MKKIAIILLFAPCILGAQVYTTLDTSYQVSQNGKFYEVREVRRSNGESSVVTTFVGDTSSIFGNYLSGIYADGNQMAGRAREASRFGADITKMIQRANEAFTITGRDALDTLTKKYSAPLLVSGWVLKDTSGTKDVTFSVNNNGQLRYAVSGFQTRNANLFGGVLRLNNYLSSGYDVDLFKSVAGNWFTIDNKLKLRFPGQNDAANRSIDAIEIIAPKPAAAPSKPAKTKKKKQ